MNAPLPKQKPGKSRQDYATPKDFLAAIEKRFGIIRTDLAASAENAVCEVYFDKGRDSLQQDWQLLKGVAYCNPEFADLDPWAMKTITAKHRRGLTLLLTPASTGADWFQNVLVPHAYILDLSPRLCFDGKNPYPKDCTLSVVGFGLVGRAGWRWKENERKTRR